MIALTAAALLFLSGDSALNQSGNSPDYIAPGFTRRDWKRLPSRGNIRSAYPRYAKRRKVEGFAIMACRIERDGSMAACAVEQETSGGLGFGAAALSLSDRYQIVMAPEGRGAEGMQIRIKVVWRPKPARYSSGYGPPIRREPRSRPDRPRFPSR